MFKYGLVIVYFTYLLIGGSSMAQGVSNAQHASNNATLYHSNMCQLLGNDKCQ